jgi:hypothetical protein
MNSYTQASLRSSLSVLLEREIFLPPEAEVVVSSVALVEDFVQWLEKTGRKRTLKTDRFRSRSVSEFLEQAILAKILPEFYGVPLNEARTFVSCSAHYHFEKSCTGCERQDPLIPRTLEQAFWWVAAAPILSTAEALAREAHARLASVPETSFRLRWWIRNFAAPPRSWNTTRPKFEVFEIEERAYSQDHPDTMNPWSPLVALGRLGVDIQEIGSFYTLSLHYPPSRTLWP